MITISVCVLLVLSDYVTFSLAGNIPDYIHICKRSDPNVSECVKESIELLRPRLIHGIPEIKAPSIEPFTLPKLEIFSNKNDMNNFEAVLNKLQMHGISNFQIKNLTVNVPKLVFKSEILIPLLQCMGEYDINANILFVKIQGKGNFYSNATDVLVETKMKAAVVEKRGVNHMVFTTIKNKITTGDYNILLENLFGGDKTLGLAVNAAINENKWEFQNVTRPYLEEKLNDVLIKFANKITNHLVYDEIFPL